MGIFKSVRDPEVGEHGTSNMGKLWVTPRRGKLVTREEFALPYCTPLVQVTCGVPMLYAKGWLKCRVFKGMELVWVDIILSLSMLDDNDNKLDEPRLSLHFIVDLDPEEEDDEDRYYHYRGSISFPVERATNADGTTIQHWDLETAFNAFARLKRKCSVKHST
jgi:hypothetical protein